jgi:SAM-dependent methyltransferase
MEISELAVNLKEKNGLFTVEEKSIISFPEDGNDSCFQLEDNSFWFKHRNKCILNVIKNYPVQGVFLDIGGGNGFVAKMLQENGYETVLIEPGLAGCINAKSRGLNMVVNAALEDIQFSQSANVSAIGAFDVIEHIEDDLAFLRSCYEVLDEKGKLFIAVPAFQFLWSEDDIISGHFRRYTTDSLIKVIENAGFKVKYKTYFFKPLVLPIFLLRTIPSKLRSKRINIESTKEEHGTEGGNMINIMNYLLKGEVQLISSGKRIDFGSSILMVASKT